MGTTALPTTGRRLRGGRSGGAGRAAITGGQLIYDFGGGGGWGDPLDRDPQAVLDDVLDEYVSVDGAERDYGVVLTGSLAGHHAGTRP